MPGLDDVRLRLGRAIANADRLNTEIQAWRSTEPYPHRTEFQFEPGIPRNRVALIARIHKDPDLNWGFLVGDILTDLRYALDYLAYQLVIAHTGQDPPPHPASIEFPIYLDPARYRKTNNSGKPMPQSGLARVANMSIPAQTYIESIQPYNGGKETDWLWALHELCNVNKHRFIHTTPAVLDETALTVAPQRGTGRVTDVTAYKIDRLKDRDVIAHLTLGGAKRGRLSEIRIEVGLAAQIVVDVGPPLPRLLLPDDMRGLVEAVYWVCVVLGPQLEPFGPFHASGRHQLAP